MQAPPKHEITSLPPDTAKLADSTQSGRPKDAESAGESATLLRTARLAYNCPAEMRRNESKDINVYVSLANPPGVMRDNLLRIVTLQQDPGTSRQVRDSVVVTDVSVYHRLRVDLLDPDSAFRVKRVFGEAWQTVDSAADNRWRWNVVAITNARTAKLVVKVIAETPEGATRDIDDRTFYIRIKMVGLGQVIRSWLVYLQDNPGMVITVILIPLIGYFGKRYFDRRTKRQKP
jgi:hypothetical protein